MSAQEFSYEQSSSISDRVRALEAVSKIFKAGDLIEVEYTDYERCKVEPYIYLGTKFLRMTHDTYAYCDVIVYCDSGIGHITLYTFPLIIRKLKL